MARYTLEQRVFLYATHVKYGSARKCWRKFRRNFRENRVPSRQTIYNFVNKPRTTWLLIHKEQKHKRRVFTEKLHDIGATLEHIHRKSLKRLAQQTGVSESSARTVTQLLKSSSESWCLMWCKCKKDFCTFSYNETINCEKYLCRKDSIFNIPCDLWIVTNIFWNLPAVRHADSSGKLIRASRQATHRPPWRVEPWTWPTQWKCSLYIEQLTNCLEKTG
jgi:hypothetical protein